jgi:hypothetical protein
MSGKDFQSKISRLRDDLGFRILELQKGPEVFAALNTFLEEMQ